MRGINLQAAQVHQTATRMLEVKSLIQEPPWYKVVEQFPPGQFMIRTQPIQHREPKTHVRIKKRSKIFRPQKIEYEEDQFRRQFYSDHPWELARPRIVLETDGKDSCYYDWSRIEQDNKQLDGESVVQRQLWLLKNEPDMTPLKAYDKARKEFYDLRQTEEIERRISKEEALSFGARFGPGPNEWGMRIEDMMYKSWRLWAMRKVEDIELKQEAGLYHDVDDENEEHESSDLVPSAI